MIARAIGVVLAACLAASGCDQAPEPAESGRAERPRPSEQAPERGRGFDFYVLSLSWSPTYCATDDNPNPRQCETSRRYGFVVHGLWPQYERGYPENCDTAGVEDVPEAIRRRLYDLMPSAGLIRHQWRKHGSCAGLSQADYFDAVRAARSRVTVPQAYARGAKAAPVDPRNVEQAFVDANPGLTPGAIAVMCRDRHLYEVRICMTKALAFRDCAEVDRTQCRSSQVSMPAP